jgi:hypothetical protein
MGCIRPASSRSDAISRLSRSCEPPDVSAASRAADESFSAGGMSCAYQLGGERADQTRETAELLAPLEALERLEHRQVRLASRQPFGTPAAANACRLSPFFELGDKRHSLPGMRNPISRFDQSGIIQPKQTGARCLC